jgi:quercetin dioxygenase-like cupin family protein
MKIIERASVDKAYGARFTGHVELEMLCEASSPERPDMARVHFFDGAMTNWHSHPGGQHLYVVSGVGRIGTEADGGREILPGTFIDAPPGERHWHGAAEGHDCVLYVATFGTTDWESDAPDGRCC